MQHDLPYGAIQAGGSLVALYFEQMCEAGAAICQTFTTVPWSHCFKLRAEVQVAILDADSIGELDW